MASLAYVEDRTPPEGYGEGVAGEDGDGGGRGSALEVAPGDQGEPVAATGPGYDAPERDDDPDLGPG